MLCIYSSIIDKPEIYVISACMVRIFDCDTKMERYKTTAIYDKRTVDLDTNTLGLIIEV